MTTQPESWAAFPWLDLRRSEMCTTTPFAPYAIWRAAEVLRASGLTDDKAANILVSADSTTGQVMGVEAFVDQVLTIMNADWTERTEL